MGCSGDCEAALVAFDGLVILGKLLPGNGSVSANLAHDIEGSD